MGTAGVQVLDMPALGVQCVRGHQDVGQVDPIQQRSERSDLVGLPVDLGLPEYDAGSVVERGQQMHLSPIIGAGAASGLPVDRDHPQLPLG